jgi:hypothetical protein
MQSLLYLIEEADAHYRNGKLGLALKKYAAVQKVCVTCFQYSSFAFYGVIIQVFNEIEDDQYDFHGYSLRKFTVNIYMKYCFSCHGEISKLIFYSRAVC